MTVVGVVPEGRHSHSACPYGGGLVIFGGLGKGGRPLGDAFYLRPTSSGFCWETKNLHPPPVPRFQITNLLGVNELNECVMKMCHLSVIKNHSLGLCFQIFSLSPCNQWEVGCGWWSLASGWWSTRSFCNKSEHWELCGDPAGYRKLLCSWSWTLAVVNGLL